MYAMKGSSEYEVIVRVEGRESRIECSIIDQSAGFIDYK